MSCANRNALEKTYLKVDIVLFIQPNKQRIVYPFLQNFAKEKAIWYHIKQKENEIKRNENSKRNENNRKKENDKKKKHEKNKKHDIKREKRTTKKEENEIKVNDLEIEDLEEVGNSTSSQNDSSNDGNTSPTMVFSVIGDSDSFVPRPWPKTVFQTALIEAAKSGGGMFFLDTIVIIFLITLKES